MDRTNGNLISEEDFQKLNPLEKENFMPVELKNLNPNQIKNNKVGRNDLCPCGSNKKFKKCCLK